MSCPHCQSSQTSQQNGTTDLGYQHFRCRACRRKFNERTGTPFNHLEFPTDIIFQVLFCRFRYKLSLRNLAEMFLLRGFEFTQEAVREWEARFARLFVNWLRQPRQGRVGSRWYVDETYLKVKGRWCYLYRAIDYNGNLVDSLLSSTRDMAAAQCFFQSALLIAGEVPRQVTTDGHDSYPRAVRETLGPEVEHRNNAYLNRRIEQDHRGVKQRYYPMLGFGAFSSAQRFCHAFEEVRQYFRPRRRGKQFVSLSRARQQFVKKVRALEAMFLAAYLTTLMGAMTKQDQIPTAVPPVLTLSMEEQAEQLATVSDFRGFCWFPSIDATEWDSLCTVANRRVCPMGIWSLANDGGEYRKVSSGALPSRSSRWCNVMTSRERNG